MWIRGTFLELSRRILSNEDPDVAAALHACLEAEGIEFRVDTLVTKVARLAGKNVEIRTDSPLGRGVLTASHLFVAAGRLPNTFDLGLETAGLALPKSGFLPVDERLETAVKGLFAAGDVRGGPMYTHTSW